MLPGEGEFDHGVSRAQMKNETAAPDVLIVGGGVVGLAIAEAVAGSGRSVRLLERDRLGRGASWAAGGMLSPLGEAAEAGAFLALARRSHALYPEWVGRIEAAGGPDVGLHLDGKTLVAFDAEGVAGLRARWTWQSAAGHDVRWLDAREVREVEPGLADDALAGLHLPTDGRVNNRALVESLAVAARANGADLREGASVSGLRTVGDRVVGVDTPVGPVEAGTVVLAAGAWSPALAGAPPRPVKGQMLELRADGRPIRAVIAAPGAYLIPRDTPSGPRIVVGATMEDAGFDLSTDDATIGSLHAAAARAVPALATAERTDRWAGLRPGSPDDLPVLGPDPDRPGLLHAHGHHRNGVLLAPVTAELVLDWIDGRAPSGASAFLPR